MMIFNLNIKKYDHLGLFNSRALTYSFIFLKKNGLLLSSFIKAKGFRKVTLTRHFVFSKILNISSVSFDECCVTNANDRFLVNFLYNSNNLRAVTNSFYNLILAASKV